MERRILLAILFLVLVLGTLTITATLHATTEPSEMEVTEGNIEGYITVEVNNTGIYYSVPAFSHLVNATYNGELFGGYIINTTCIYLYSYDIYNNTPINARVDVYYVINDVAYPVAELYVMGYGYYCNTSLSNASIILLVYHYNTTTIPFAIMNTLLYSVKPPPVLVPWLPLIMFAFVGLLGLWFNLRKMSIGLIASGSFMIILAKLLGLASPWWYIFSIIQIAIGLILMFLIEKNPEMF